MTTSGESAVVVGPAWLGMTVFGNTWLGLRLPIIAIAALSTPLTWVLGRKLYSDALGLTAAALVATSQVFLLYGRTATMVGMSITPALIGFILLWLTIRPGDRRWMIWLVLLQVSLIANSYFYSPIRFLWLIALALLAVECVFRRGERTRFAISFAVTAFVIPIAIMLLRPGPIAESGRSTQGVLQRSRRANLRYRRQQERLCHLPATRFGRGTGGDSELLTRSTGPRIDP